jgi:NAD(P) transhydrogenase subunit alpha
MSYNVFLAKESRAGEQRVGLTSSDVATLIAAGHSVFIESDAGLAAGYKDEDYQTVGAHIVELDATSPNSYLKAFKNIDIIVRVKRPDREREILESKTMHPGMMMIGAFDPYESESEHVNEYHRAGIDAYSLDQAKPDDPINVLTAMSRLAGKLSLRDAISKFKGRVNKVVIIGFGEVGKSALLEALEQKLKTLVLVGSQEAKEAVLALHATSSILDRSLPLVEQHQIILEATKDADIIITSARKAGQKAPLLFPKISLNAMKPGAVIVDMAISEGGNVDGSKHDETITNERGVIITNVSGYPKTLPEEASILWSKASLNFILKVSHNRESIDLKPI